MFTSKKKTTYIYVYAIDLVILLFIIQIRQKINNINLRTKYTQIQIDMLICNNRKYWPDVKIPCKLIKKKGTNNQTNSRREGKARSWHLNSSWYQSQLISSYIIITSMSTNCDKRTLAAFTMTSRSLRVAAVTRNFWSAVTRPTSEIDNEMRFISSHTESIDLLNLAQLLYCRLSSQLNNYFNVMSLMAICWEIANFFRV